MSLTNLPKYSSPNPEGSDIGNDQATSSDRPKSNSKDFPYSTLPSNCQEIQKTNYQLVSQQDDLLPPTAFLKIDPIVQERILFYRSLGISALPVVKARSAKECPLKVKDSKGNWVVKYDKEGNPIQAFTGKNPSFETASGKCYPIAAKEFQSRLPTWAEYIRWFAVPQWGIGYAHPSSGQYVTIDIDRKHWETQAEYDLAQDYLKVKCPDIFSCHDKTINKGDHLLVKSTKIVHFTNFSFDKDTLKHHGEVLKGFCVCYPTPGYELLSSGEVPTVDFNDLPIYPVKAVDKAVEAAAKDDRTDTRVDDSLTVELSLDGQGVKVEWETLEQEDQKLLEKLRSLKTPVALEKLLTKASIKFLSTQQEGIDRTGETVKLYHDAHGAANFCRLYSIPFVGDPDELVARGSQLNGTYDKLDRVLSKVGAKESSVSPIALKRGHRGFLYHIAVSIGLIKPGQKYKRFSKEKWQRYRSFTPKLTINERFLFDRDQPASFKQMFDEWLDSYDLIFIRSGLGTGKTEAFAEYLKDKYGVLLIGYRNALLISICERVNKLRGDLAKMHHLQKDEARELRNDLQSLLALCLDSLHHFSNENLEGRIVVIDEAMSVILHLMTSNTLAKFARKNADDFWAKGRAQYLAKFAQVVGRASKIMVLDGHLNDALCVFFNRLRDKAGKPESSLKVLNTYQAAKLNVKIIEALNEDGMPNGYNGTPVIRHIWSVLESRIVGQKRNTIAIVADSAKKLQSLHTSLIERGYNCLLVFSGTTGEARKTEFPLQHQFCEDPTKFIDEHPEIDVILMSPTVESGIDISSKERFLCGFAFFVGLLSTNTYLQFLRRVRDCSDWFIHIVPKCNLYDKRSLSEWHDAGVYYLDSTLSDDDLKVSREQAIANTGAVKNSISWGFHSELLDSLLYERDNSKECLIDALCESGHTVEVVQLPSDEMIKDEMECITDTRYRQQSVELCNAQKIPFEAAQELMRKIDRTDSEQLQLDRALLVHDLGGEDNCELINEDFVFSWLKNRKKGELETMKRRIYIKRKADFELMNKKNLIKDFSNQSFDIDRAYLGLEQVSRQAKICIHDLPIEKIKLTAMHDLDIASLVDGNWHDAESPKLLEFKQKISDNPTLLGIFGHGIKSENPKQWVKALHTLLEEFGFRIENSRSRANGRKRQYQYFLSEPTEAEKNVARAKEKDANKLAVLEAQWLQSEKLEACVNKAFDNRLEALGAKPSDKEFDPNILLIRNVPHHYEWANSEDCEGIDVMWNEAIETVDTEQRTEKLEHVIKFVKALWDENKPEVTIAVNQDVVITTTVKRQTFAEMKAKYIKEVGIEHSLTDEELREICNFLEEKYAENFDLIEESNE